MRQLGGSPRSAASSLLTWALILALLLALASPALASVGDDLPEFQDCVERCRDENCQPGSSVRLPLHLRLLFWDCPSECDYVCQRHITAERIRDHKSIEQFHGKWPFLRFYGIQEPFSVLFSIMNGHQHLRGLRHIQRELPKSYPMRRYYEWLSYVGMACWFFSSVFHTRDSILTERLDYFGAGANVMYSFFYAPVRIFRLYERRQNFYKIQVWGTICAFLYFCHVFYLQFVRWDYTYNMAANVIVGSLQNCLWTYYSCSYYSRLRRPWAAWPGLIVTWLIAAMSLELLDFPPVWDAIDAHSLWHAATILPTYWWYRFLVVDAKEDIHGHRLKA